MSSNFVHQEQSINHETTPPYEGHPRKTHWNDVAEDMISFGTSRGMHGLTINGKGDLLG